MALHAQMQVMLNAGSISAPKNYDINEAYADAIKESVSFNDVATGTTPVATDSNGWPKTDCRFLLFADLSDTQGTYQIRFNGRALVGNINFGATFSPGPSTYGSDPNPHTGLYDPNTNTTTLTMVATTAGNSTLLFSNTHNQVNSPENTGVTNIQIMRPTAPYATTSYPFGTLFTNQFISAAKKFKICRYMDSTNSNIESNWSDRVLPGAAFQNDFTRQIPDDNDEGQGSSWEYRVAFANVTGTDMWINIPYLATGETTSDTTSYIYQLALLLKYGSDGVQPYTGPAGSGGSNPVPAGGPIWAPLNGNLNIYIEYSNEVWNGYNSGYDPATYPQSGGYHGPFCQNAQNVQALTKHQANNDADWQIINYDGQGFQQWPRMTALRIKQTSDIFRAVFSPAEMVGTSTNPRVRPVYEYQYQNANLTAITGLEFLNNCFNNIGGTYVSVAHPLSYYLYGAGAAVYYSNDQPASGVTINNVNDFYNDVATPGLSYLSDMENETLWAKIWGLKFTSYEGGWSVGSNTLGGGASTNAIAVAAKSDPRAKQTMVTSLQDVAAADADVYAQGTYAFWDNVDNPDASPLVQALNDLNSGVLTLPPPSYGTVLNSTAPTSLTYSDTTGYGSPWGNIFIVSQTTTFQLTVNNNPAAGNHPLAIAIDGQSFGSPQLMNGTLTVPQTFTLTPGVHGLVIQDFTGYNPSITSVAFTPVVNASPVAPPGYTYVVPENGSYTFTQNVNVAYGAYDSAGNPHFNYENGVTGPISFNNTTFGDPLVGTFKAGFYQVVPTGGPQGPPGYTYVAPENGSYTFAQSVNVAYGAYDSSGNPHFNYGYGVTGSVTFDNVTFGDPLVGTFKAGFYQVPVDPDTDIGAPSQAGSASISGSTYTIKGGGADIWGTRDQFNFDYIPTSGTAHTLVAKVTSITNTNSWAKAGVMFRDSTATGAIFVDMVATQGSGVSFQWRSVANGNCSDSQTASVGTPTSTNPVWVKLVKNGATYTGYYSLNGTTWNQVGTQLITFSNANYLSGLAVTAHNNAALNTAIFTNVTW